MRYRQLGRSGLTVSVVGLGGNNFGRAHTATEDQPGTDAVIGAALEAGITLIDGADIYGARPGLSEERLGVALRGRRDQVVLATKFGMDMQGAAGPDWGVRASRRYVRRAVHDSLRRLQTDWIDLYQLHQPDPAVPIAETLDVLDDLVREGLVRYIGHSNLAGWQIAEAEFTARMSQGARFVSAQNEYSLLERRVESEVLPAVRAYELGFLPYFPLYNGLLTGKYRRDEAVAGRLTAAKPHLLETAPWQTIEDYRAFCEERGVGMLEATFAWLLAQPGLTSVIAGATSAEQVRANAEAATAWTPTTADLEAIDDLFRDPR